jgi:DNA-binding transcriptional LysR family regulator
MELYQLRTFVTVAEEGSLTKAASRLYASQPAVSAHIKALEDELGLALFKRTPRGMLLTEAGKVLRKRADHILHQTDIMLAEAKQLSGEVSGELRVGLNTDSEFLRITELLELLAERYPELKLHLVQSSTEGILREVRARRLDAGFVFYGLPVNDLATETLAKSRLQIVAPAHWKDRVEGQPAEKLLELPWVWPATHCPFRNILAENADLFHTDPANRIEVDSEDIIRQLVAAGKGLSIMREDEAQSAVKAGKVILCLEDRDFTTNILFTYLKNRQDDPAVTALVQAVKDVWKD